MEDRFQNLTNCPSDLLLIWNLVFEYLVQFLRVGELHTSFCDSYQKVNSSARDTATFGKRTSIAAAHADFTQDVEFSIGVESLVTGEANQRQTHRALNSEL